jgi:hypothetical protein
LFEVFSFSKRLLSQEKLQKQSFRVANAGDVVFHLPVEIWQVTRIPSSTAGEKFNLRGSSAKFNK